MKKIALTSLLAVFAVSGAHAANVIDGNPLYRPGEGHFASVTTLASDTDNTTQALLGEEFAYGITDRLLVSVGATLSQSDWFDTASWNAFSIGADYRFYNGANWKADLYGSYHVLPVWGDHEAFLDKDITDYKWTVGARAGYTTAAWTVAGHIAFDYLNTESFNWDDGDFAAHLIRFGLDGQLVLNSQWNLVAGVEYTADYDNWSENVGLWTGVLGANFNIDETKFVGAYISKEMTHEAAGSWEVQDGFGFGVKFGIDF